MSFIFFDPVYLRLVWGTETQKIFCDLDGDGSYLAWELICVKKPVGNGNYLRSKSLELPD